MKEDGIYFCHISSCLDQGMSSASIKNKKLDHSENYPFKPKPTLTRLYESKTSSQSRPFFGVTLTVEFCSMNCAVTPPTPLV